MEDNLKPKRPDDETTCLTRKIFEHVVEEVH